MNSLVARFLIALLVTAAAIGVRIALSRVLGEDRVPYITLFPALLFVGWFCGLLPSFASLIVGALAVDYFILPPRFSLGINDPKLVAGIVMYIVMGSVCVLMGNLVARSLARAIKSEQLALSQKEELERASIERERLATIVDSSDDAIIAKNLDGVITSWNAGAQRLFGYSSEEANGQPVTMLIPPDRFDEEPQIINRIRRGEPINHYETVRRRKDGSLVHLSLSVSPLRDASGKIIGASKIARDVTLRREQQEALANYRDHLEELVKARTAEAMESQTRLRHAERLASIGTLAAGLGHDIGNVLMPLEVNMRRLMQPIQSDETLEAVRQESFNAIERGVEYLRSLSNGLRMLTRDRSDRPDADAATRLPGWWREVRPLLAALAKRSITLRDELPTDLPPVRLSEHLLTQVVFNLVQNAVQALGDCSDAKIIVRATAEQPGQVVLQVIDNGQGMPPDVLRQCLEPFFTTKTRGISSGLGLSIVNGIVMNAGGTVEIESEPGRGTTFTLRLPASASTTGDDASTRLSADVSIEDSRVRAMVTSMLNASRVRARQRDAAAAPDRGARLWIADAASVPEVLTHARSYLNGHDGIARHMVVLWNDDHEPEFQHERLVRIDRAFRPAQFRDVLESIIKELQG